MSKFPTVFSVNIDNPLLPLFGRPANNDGIGAIIGNISRNS